MIRQIPRTPENAEVHEGLKPPAGAGGRPLEPDGHELHEGPFLRPTVREVDLDCGREQGEVAAKVGILHLGEDPPKPLEARHAREMEEEVPHPCPCM